MPRGGKRRGAGRKPLGITRKVSLTLTPEEWKQIEQSGETVAAFVKKLMKEVTEIKQENEQLKKQVTKIKNEQKEPNNDDPDNSSNQTTSQSAKQINTLSPVEVRIFWNQISRGKQPPEVETYLRMESVQRDFFRIILSNNTIQDDQYICPVTGKAFTDRKRMLMSTLESIIEEKRKAHLRWAQENGTIS